jgi:hypothetical protein
MIEKIESDDEVETKNVKPREKSFFIHAEGYEKGRNQFGNTTLLIDFLRFLFRKSSRKLSSFCVSVISSKTNIYKTLRMIKNRFSSSLDAKQTV